MPCTIAEMRTRYREQCEYAPNPNGSTSFEEWIDFTIALGFLAERDGLYYALDRENAPPPLSEDEIEAYV